MKEHSVYPTYRWREDRKYLTQQINNYRLIVNFNIKKNECLLYWSDIYQKVFEEFK